MGFFFFGFDGKQDSVRLISPGIRTDRPNRRRNRFLIDRSETMRPFISSVSFYLVLSLSLSLSVCSSIFLFFSLAPYRLYFFFGRSNLFPSFPLPPRSTTGILRPDFREKKTKKKTKTKQKVLEHKSGPMECDLLDGLFFFFVVGIFDPPTELCRFFIARYFHYVNQ